MYSGVSGSLNKIQHWVGRLAKHWSLPLHRQSDSGNRGRDLVMSSIGFGGLHPGHLVAVPFAIPI